MKHYGLLTKDGEVINKLRRESIVQAIASFAILKKLSREALLEVYVVAPIKG
jgi:hypothetical protein